MSFGTFCPYFRPWTKWFRECGWISWCHLSTKCANHVKLSQIVAIRTTFCTNYFWKKSRYFVYLLFPPSLLLQFFDSPCIWITSQVIGCKEQPILWLNIHVMWMLPCDYCVIYLWASNAHLKTSFGWQKGGMMHPSGYATYWWKIWF